MGKPSRNEDLPMVFACQLDSYVLTEGGRISAQIDSNVQHSPLHYADKFGLCMGRLLKMQTPHYTVRGQRFIVLHKVDFHSGLLGESSCIETFEKVTATVAENGRLNDQDIRYGSRNDFHLFNQLLLSSP
ncbi:MAG: hypothetical protein AUK63_1253 [bacterium P3]|nr:MAG: hypothetical protein AUK63_1253 [bacterium P3]KWW40361.1 MAG: hypothetical protein F083_1598 [bacterium F083]